MNSGIFFKKYVAFTIGIMPGVYAGGAIGLFSGIHLGPLLGVCVGAAPLFGIHLDCIVGALVGLVLGVILGSLLTGGIAVYKVQKKTKPSQQISPDNINEILLSGLGIALETSIGMSIGAIIGSLKSPGIGTLIGAITGTALILITKPIKKIRAEKANV